jgi:hypothetical protein
MHIPTTIITKLEQKYLVRGSLDNWPIYARFLWLFSHYFAWSWHDGRWFMRLPLFCMEVARNSESHFSRTKQSGFAIYLLPRPWWNEVAAEEYSQRLGWSLGTPGSLYWIVYRNFRTTKELA